MNMGNRVTSCVHGIGQVDLKFTSRRVLVLHRVLHIPDIRRKIEGGYMGDTDGMIKVTVVKGNRLAIRDFRTSDPYVILHLENQTKKTRVINSCLNPIWNEEFTFSLVGSNPVLKLEVFDHDTFKYDDKMGHAFLNLQPLISASRLKHALQLSTGETNLRRVPVDPDNCLMEDSSIICINGEIVQDVRLRLSDVESGELILQVKWMGNT